MSGSVATVSAAVPLAVRGVRLLVNAVVDGSASVFDPSLLGRFAVTAPPSGWLDMGNVLDLKREAETTFTDVASGTPAMVKTRARTGVSAQVSCTLTNWSKPALLLSGG